MARSEVYLVCHLLLYDDTKAAEVTNKENPFKSRPRTLFSDICCTSSVT